MTKPKTNRVDLAQLLSDSAVEAVPVLKDRMPAPAAATAASTLAAAPTGLKVKKIERVNTSVRLPPELLESLTQLLDGKRRGVWIEHRMSELFEANTEEILLRLVVDRAEAESRIEDKDSGEQVFSVRLEPALTDRVSETAERLECDRSLVFRAWIHQIVDNHSAN